MTEAVLAFLEGAQLGGQALGHTTLRMQCHVLVDRMRDRVCCGNIVEALLTASLSTSGCGAPTPREISLALSAARHLTAPGTVLVYLPLPDAIYVTA